MPTAGSRRPRSAILSARGALLDDEGLAFDERGRASQDARLRVDVQAAV